MNLTFLSQLCDTPGIPCREVITRHGDGVGIMIQDSSMIAHLGLIEDRCKVASKKKKIPYQRCIFSRGGQDAAAINLLAAWLPKV